MLRFLYVLGLLGLLRQVKAGCRYTNPEWDQERIQQSAPSIQVAVTSRELKIQAKWNSSVISAYPQCVDQLILNSTYGVICETKLSENSCDSNKLENFRNEVCQSESVQFWLTLINEDHKENLQNIEAPALTEIKDLCSNPSVSIKNSDSCRAVIPKWLNEPHIEYLKGRRSYRELKINWENVDIQGFACLEFFEVKYWPRGKASRSFVTSAIEVKSESNFEYSTVLEVDECIDYTFIIRAVKSNPSVVVNHRGSFKSKCKAEIANRKLSSTTVKTTRRTTKSTTTTSTTTTTKTTTKSSTTTTTTTTSKSTTTSTSTPIRTTTTISSTTETTRLTSMLFNPKGATTTENIEEKTLENLLFKEESTPRLPKTSVENFQGVASAETSTEKSLEIQTTFNVTEAEYQMMGDEPFEYVDSVQEESKYLESAIGLPEYDDESIEANEIYNDHEDATDFDELLARTQGAKEKNPRSLEFDGYNQSVMNKGFPGLFIILSLISIFHLN